MTLATAQHRVCCQSVNFLSKPKCSLARSFVSCIFGLTVIQGVHPRLIADGFELAKDEALKVLDEMKIKGTSREVLIQVARTSLRTKLDQALADHITEVIRLWWDHHSSCHRRS